MLIGFAYPMLAQVRVRCNVDDFESGAFRNVVLPWVSAAGRGPPHSAWSGARLDACCDHPTIYVDQLDDSSQRI